MIEPIMFFGIGFLVAGLFGLVLIPLVHNRAVRLTMRRLEAATPLSMAEIQADKDQLRAEFAMSTRRLELSVEQMKSKTTSQLAELGKKTDAINRLKLELGEKTAAIFAFEAREKSLRDQLQTTENEFSVKIGSLREAERIARRQAGRARQAQHRSRRALGPCRQPAHRSGGAAHPGRGAQAAASTNTKRKPARSATGSTGSARTRATRPRGAQRRARPRSSSLANASASSSAR